MPNRRILLIAWLVFGVGLFEEVLAQEAGTIGTTTTTVVTRQLTESTTTTTTNNLSQSLLITASGVTATGGDGSLLSTSSDSYNLQTPSGSVPTTVVTTVINPSIRMIPTTPGGDIQLTITNELPGIKSVSITQTSSDTTSNSESFSVYTTPLRP